MDYKNAKELLEKYGQEHLLTYYGELSKEEQAELLKDIESIDFDILKNIGTSYSSGLGEISPIGAVTLQDIERRKAEFEEVGLNLLREGKVGAVLLAGGQGSRLGFDKPKGMYNIGVSRTLSIFEQQMNNIAEVTEKSGRHFPLFIMTSVNTHSETVKFFAENNYFGYPEGKIHFFMQDVAPACSYDGKIYLDKKHRVSLTPNGNGGWYSSLLKSGLGKVIESEGVEWLNVYAVDNVLQRICDPVFIGATIAEGCSCGAKVVRKANPEEKVGVLCKENGRPSIVEYYEMPENLKNETKDGQLVYCYGVILNYLFNVQELNAAISVKLPWHLADKAIAHIENGEQVKPAKPCGYKFETLVVDMIKFMESCLAFEVDREREFAPVKNLTGVDSVDTARALLERNGIIL